MANGSSGGLLNQASDSLSKHHRIFLPRNLVRDGYSLEHGIIRHHLHTHCPSEPIDSCRRKDIAALTEYVARASAMVGGRLMMTRWASDGRKLTNVLAGETVKVPTTLLSAFCTRSMACSKRREAADLKQDRRLSMAAHRRHRGKVYHR